MRWIVGAIVGFIVIVAGWLTVMAGATGGGHW